MNIKVSTILQSSLSINSSEAVMAREYFKEMGLNSTALPSSIKYCHELEYLEGTSATSASILMPGIVAEVRNSKNEIIGLLQIYLNAFGKKADVSNPEQTVGQIKEGAIFLGGEGSEMHVAVGLETALAIRQSIGKKTYSMVNANDLKKFTPPIGTTEVHIWVDKSNSKDGEDSAIKLVEYLKAIGIRGIIHIPNGPVMDNKNRLDWLDILKSNGSSAIEKEYSYDPNAMITYSLGEFLENEEFAIAIPVIHDLIHRGELTILAATAKTGKSWLALEAALSVAMGKLFLDRFTTIQGRVLIVQTEVPKPMFCERVKSRLEKISIGIPPLENFFISSQRIRIDTSDGIRQLRNEIKKRKIDLVILDPLYTLHTKEENSATEMSQILSNLREVLQTENCAGILVHHRGKQGEDNGNQISHRMRGSSSLTDVPDNIWIMNRGKEKSLRTLHFEMRSAEPPHQLVLEFKAPTWRITDGEKRAPDGSSIEDIVVLLPLHPAKMKKKDLVNLAKEKYGISEKTVENRLRLALSLSRICNHEIGREVEYWQSEPTQALPQVSNPLDACENADVNNDLTLYELRLKKQHEAASGK